MKPYFSISSTLLSLAFAFPGIAGQPNSLGEKQLSAAIVPVLATLSEDTGSAERIESADFLRIYTQEIAAAACYLYNGIESDLSLELLKEARHGFDLHLDALLNGNEALGIIGGEQRRKTVVELEEILSLWKPFAAATDALMANPNDGDAVHVIKSRNVTLFEKTDHLVSTVEGEYSNPAELLQSDVLTLEIVGRQAMMSQKIAKFACQIFTGDGSQEVAKGLSDAMRIYDVSLNALLNGMPEVGVIPAPTPEIRQALTEVLNDWEKTRPDLDTLLSTGTLSREKQIELFQHMSDEMHDLEKIAHKYVVFSKH